MSPPKQFRLDEAEFSALLKDADRSQSELDRLNDEASDEILKLESKYVKLRAPHFQARDEVLAKIPQFWPTVLLNHPQLSALIEDQDDELIKFLRRLEIDEDVRVGYKIRLHFDENPFFTNSTLEKCYRLDDPANSRVSEVEWKEGKNFLEANGNDAAGSVGSNRKRSHIDYPSDSSSQGFFAWFLGDCEMGSDSVGDAIKDDVYVNPLQYFLDEGDDEDSAAGAPEDEEPNNGYCANAPAVEEDKKEDQQQPKPQQQ